MLPLKVTSWSALLLLCLVAFTGTVRSQQNDTPPPAPRQAATIPIDRPLPPGIGPGAATFPGAPSMPGAPAGIGAGARPLPGMDQDIRMPPQLRTPPAPIAISSPGVIERLDAIAPLVQAFDFVLMMIAGIACLRARAKPGLLLLAISCFVSAIILLGFFSFGVTHGHGLFAQAAYVSARLLAPFELLLFAIAIVLVAARSR